MAQQPQIAEQAPNTVMAGDKAPTSRRPVRVIAFLAAIAISLGVLWLTHEFRHELKALGGAGILGLFAVSVIGNATVVIPAPVFVFACAAGTIYGPVLGGVVSGIGSAIGELTGYLAGYGGNAALPRNMIVRRLEEFMSRYGVVAIFILAALPNPLFDLGGIMAGIMRMPAHKFVVAAALGKSVRLIFVGWACASGIPAIEQWMHPPR